MSDLISELSDTFADPARRHAATVHLPVAMALLGVLVAAVAAVLRRTNAARAVAIGWFLLLAIAAFVAKRSGTQAEGRLPADLPSEAFARLEEHAQMGERIWLAALAVAVLFGLSALRNATLRIAALVLAVAGSVFVAGLTGATAHHGGELVYGHGAGTDVLPELLARRAEAAAAFEEEGNDGATPRVDMVAMGDLDPRQVFFIESVEPILAASCQSCHNSARPKAGLDLTSAAGVLRGGRGVGDQVVVPGRPEVSLLLEAVRGIGDRVDPMPPDDQLSPEEIAVLERWIREGAAWGTAAPPSREAGGSS